MTRDKATMKMGLSKSLPTTAQPSRLDDYNDDDEDSVATTGSIEIPSSPKSSRKFNIRRHKSSVRIRTKSYKRLTLGISELEQLGIDTDHTRITNWAETVEADMHQFRYPASVDEVVELVRANEKIRCSGALHSCAPLITTEGIILSLTRLDEIIDVDVPNRLVRLQSGVRIHDLCDELAEHDLAVGTLGTIDWQTISGAVMTGTHGGALSIPSLHDYVRSYSLVTPDGSLKKIARATQPDLFSAM